jgi:glycosyltransferase involved in cell wall biosynthesis
MTSSRNPRFSIVSAAYGVATYLPDFIAAIEGQTFDLADVEVIMVDDGSTDETSTLLDQWQRRRPDLVQVVHQDNAGQAVARNTGLALARGEWVTFPDPDDVVEPDYLANVATFLGEHPETDLVATHRLMWFEAEGEPRNSHRLRHLFTSDQLVDLDRTVGYFHSSAPAGFFRLDRVRAQALEFDPEVRPIFEDGHFTVRYLLDSDHRKVAFLQSAKYHYRRRSDASSTMQGAKSDIDRYLRVPRHGYLDVVRRAKERFGTVPPWLQHHLVFDLSFYFTFSDSDAPPNRPTDGPEADEFHALMAEILADIDVDAVVPVTATPLQRIPRYVLQHGYRDQPWHEPFVAAERFDDKQRLVQLIYTFAGPAPVEELRCEGVAVAPKHAKYRPLTYCGRTLLRQRIIWVPARQSVELLLDGSPMDLVFQRPPFAKHRLTPGEMFYNLAPESKRVEKERAELLDPVPTTAEGKRALKAMQRPKVRERYRNAWVLMDRIHDAGDSGEILFRHIRANYPEINAFFVIEKDTADWRRLRADGYSDRLVAHGSAEWRLLMAHCIHLVSSHADKSVIEPPAITEFTRPGWRNTFLNHGVIKDDLSGWLTRKPLSTFVTSSRQEYAAIAGDDSAYTFTTREVHNTGMPRFDRLLEVGSRFPADRRDLVLMAPTWRKWLVAPVEITSQRRVLDLSALDSDFVKQWLELLNNPQLTKTCAAANLTVGFLPHPNLQPLLPHLDLPSHVQPLTYEGNDVQEFFARSRVLVTDFSSIAFNAAYLERPAVYFQFDEDRVREGDHVGRKDYFDYRRDGFGPVETTADEAAAAICAAIEHGPNPLPAYQQRIDATFPERDGRCSDRVIAAIRNSIQPQGGAEPVPTPVQPAATSEGLSAGPARHDRINPHDEQH